MSSSLLVLTSKVVRRPVMERCLVQAYNGMGSVPPDLWPRAVGLKLGLQGLGLVF